MLRNKSQRLAKFILACTLALIIFLLYLPGVSGTFYYDDIRPLSGLANINDLESALIFISTESSGPLGRPLSMLSFIFNINDWPNSASPGRINAFFTFNILLHIINGLLVFALSYFIIKLYRDKNCYWLALSVSAFWLVLPIQASSTLIAIQRMASLSAFFVFSGLLFYVYGLYLQSKSENNKAGLSLQLLGLFLFTTLAMFSKENGVLLPVFILILEVTILSHVIKISYRRKLRIRSCALGLIVIIAYLAYFAINSNNVLAGREYTLLERLLTQPQILIEYIRLAFIPDITAINPFHDSYSHVVLASINTWSILAIVVVLSLIMSAIYFNKKSPVYSFAILWFFSAHLLESSVLNLELYYQHRNYVALFGLCLALVFTIAKTPSKYKKVSFFLASCYWAILAFSLAMTSQLWGDSLLAAKTWHNKQLGSERASAHLAYIYFNRQEHTLAWETLEQQTKQCPSCINSQAQAMLFSCFSGKKQQTLEHYQQIITLAPQATQANSTAKTIAQVFQLIGDKHCSALNQGDLKQLNRYLLQKLPESPYNKKLPYIQNLYNIALSERDRNEAIRLLYLAWEQQADYNIANEFVSMLIASRKHQQAQYFITEEACQISHRNPVLDKLATRQCKALTEKLASALNKKNLASETTVVIKHDN